MNNIRKFEDFLDKMQGLIDNAKKQGHIIIPIEDIENTFPELKESEDERIRKKLIIAFQSLNTIKVWNGIERIDIIAWLEKQGNQTIFNTPSKETILAIWELGNDWKELTNGVISTEHGTQLDYIQKHWSESEHYLREKRKHEPASNEQRDTLIKAMTDAGYTFDFDKKELKKIDNHATWSEEDENNLTDTCVAIRKFYHGTNGAQELIDWLKSLKDKYMWKPSEEQIEALESATENCAYSEYQDCLKELIVQLKKL